MWNTLHMTWLNRNGDKPTISADSFNTIILCHSILNVSLQMHHTNHMTSCSDHQSPFNPPLFWPQGGHRAGGESVRGSPCVSQLLALQHGLGRGAGEQDGAGVRRGESELDVEPLACQSCIAAARARSLFHGCGDALMPLCWRCSR